MQLKSCIGKLSSISLITLCSVSAYADNCDHARNTFDDVYCTNKIYASADADLNKHYQTLRSKLNSKQKNLLKTSQRHWIEQRDSVCVEEDTQAVNVNCRLQQTRERNYWLQERLRECKTVGCKTSTLSD